MNACLKRAVGGGNAVAMVRLNGFLRIGMKRASSPGRVPYVTEGGYYSVSVKGEHALEARWYRGISPYGFLSIGLF